MKSCFFLPPRLPSGAGCRGTQARWEGMAGGYGLDAGVGVELVKKSSASSWNNAKARALGVAVAARKEVTWATKSCGKRHRAELGEQGVRNSGETPDTRLLKKKKEKKRDGGGRITKGVRLKERAVGSPTNGKETGAAGGGWGVASWTNKWGEVRA